MPIWYHENGYRWALPFYQAETAQIRYERRQFAAEHRLNAKTNQEIRSDSF